MRLSVLASIHAGLRENRDFESHSLRQFLCNLRLKSRFVFLIAGLLLSNP